MNDDPRKINTPLLGVVSLPEASKLFGVSYGIMLRRIDKGLLTYRQIEHDIYLVDWGSLNLLSQVERGKPISGLESDTICFQKIR